VRKCLSCGHRFDATSAHIPCPACHAGQVIIDGFAAFAPDLARSGESFKPEYFAKLADQEAQSFWFRYRNKLIVWAVQRYCNGFKSLIELGCGTGYVLSAIAANWPGRTLKGSDIFVAGLTFASRRLDHVEFVQMDGRAIPYADHFDAIGAFDVLEHIEEDESVLAQIRTALRSNGTLILSVPQHAWLWSPLDDYACHVRRYDAKDLHDKIERAGFQIKLSTSFISALLPAMFASRYMSRGKAVSDIDITSELQLPPWLNKLSAFICDIEFALIRAGLRLPIGGSRLIVATRADRMNGLET
jgi:SAM-dependent methyltransferase